MKNVMIYAYTANNLGDDLFIHTLCTRYPKVRFQCYAPKSYQKTFSYIKNLEIIPSDKLLNKVVHAALKPYQKEYFLREQLARTCEIGVYVGGSIFMEQADWEKEVKNVQSMKATHASFLILGANFGPYKSDKFYQTYEQLFQGITDICFRDHQSKELFVHLPNVRQAADIAFQFQYPVADEKSKNQIMISVIYPSIRESLTAYDTTYFEGIASISSHLIRKGYDVLLMAFCKQEKDDEAVRKIISYIPKKLRKQIETYSYTTNLHEAISKIGASRAIIATRFHAMILGWVMKKPVFPIIYSSKMKTVMEDIHFKGNYSTVENIHLMNLEKIVQAIQQEPIDHSELVIDAGRQFDVLDTILK